MSDQTGAAKDIVCSAAASHPEAETVRPGKGRYDAKPDLVPFSKLCQLRHLAFEQARYGGMSEEDAHDCSMEFVLRAARQVLATGAQASAESGGAECSSASIPVSALLRNDLSEEHTDFWLRRCARNWASNWQRGLARRQSHELSCSQLGVTPETLDTSPSSLHAPSAEEDALARLFRQDIHAACGQLPPPARVLFECFHLHGDSMAELAFSSGKSEEAVKQTLYRSRRHLRGVLAQTEEGLL